MLILELTYVIKVLFLSNEASIIYNRMFRKIRIVFNVAFHEPKNTAHKILQSSPINESYSLHT